MTEAGVPTSRVARGARIGRIAAAHTARDVVGSVRKPFLSEDEQRAARDQQALRLADDLVRALGSMRGAAMKLGQTLSLLDFGLSSRAARAEFARRIAPLFNQAPPVDTAAMMRLLDAEWGAHSSLVAHLEPDPIATASLGQVYRAQLVDGRAVAVKVQYPSIQHAVRADLKNLALLIRLRPRLYAEVGLEDVVAEISRQIALELDYRRELSNHRAIYDANRGHPVFVIPAPVEELCTDRVLVTEYLEGRHLHQLGGIDSKQRDHIGEAVYRFYCGSLYSTGSFCADPHPGNVMLLADDRIGFLDFGLYVDMSEREVALQRAVFAAVLHGDAATAHRLACQSGFIVDSEAFPPDVALHYIQAVGGWFLTPGEVRVTDEVARKALAQAILPHSDFRTGVFKQRLQSDHTFSRRTEMNVCALLGSLEASAPWRDIASEWILGTPPATEMGRAIARWRA